MSEEFGLKVGGGRSFVSGPFFVRLWYFHQTVCLPVIV